MFKLGIHPEDLKNMIFSEVNQKFEIPSNLPIHIYLQFLYDEVVSPKKKAESKYITWIKNPDNLWKVVAFVVGTVVAVYLAMRKP